MKEYKRLTERTKRGIAILDNGGKFVLSCGGYATKKALKRLAELEDKIENGSLREFPCNIGDTIYWVNTYCPKPRVEEYKCYGFQVTERGGGSLCSNRFW